MGASNNFTGRDRYGFELVENADNGHLWGHCVQRGMGHNSKTCPEHSRILVFGALILDPVINTQVECSRTYFTASTVIKFVKYLF